MVREGACLWIVLLPSSDCKQKERRGAGITSSEKRVLRGTAKKKEKEQRAWIAGFRKSCRCEFNVIVCW